MDDEIKKVVIGGDFIEGGTVTVLLDGEEYTRKVKYSVKKWGDLYITIKGKEYMYSEFEYKRKGLE